MAEGLIALATLAVFQLGAWFIIRIDAREEAALQRWFDEERYLPAAAGSGTPDQPRNGDDR